MVYGENSEALAQKNTFPDGKVDRITCCQTLKSEALKNTLSGEWNSMLWITGQADTYLTATGKSIPE